MKIIVSSVCLAAALSLVANAAPEKDTQSYYAQVLQRDEPQVGIEMIDFLTSFVAQDKMSKSEAKAKKRKSLLDSNELQPKGLKPEDCSETALRGLADSTMAASAVDMDLVLTILESLVGSAANVAKEKVLYIINETLSMIGLAPGADKKDSDSEDAGHNFRKRLEVCAPVLEFKKESGPSCAQLADAYRTVISEAIKASPAVPTSASDDLKRACAGSLSVLDIMNSYSIAKTNDALLAMRPIFFTEALNDFTQEMTHWAKNAKSITKYAQTHLAKAVTVANALDACLYNAAAPEYAVDDVADNEEEVDYEDEE
ncbi:hypothetical protein BGZ72_010340 [Mortierella alpina]|nr:hypothetical protein BGZ72_010340 [Mortierella alpina]